MFSTPLPLTLSLRHKDLRSTLPVPRLLVLL